jgi:hypothetical protein
VQDKQGKDQQDHNADQPRLRRSEQEAALEETRHGVHGILAEKDARHGEHVPPHEQHQRQAREALGQIQPGRPASVAGK